MDKINAEVFVTVAALGSYKKAADKLGYTQAGISYIINAMEEQAGMKFFEREYGGVRMTQEGKELLPSMQRLYQDELIVREKVDKIRGLETGEIRVLAINTVIVCYLPDILKEFKVRYPGITIEVSACDSAERATELLANGSADCAFIQIVSSDRIEIIPLGKQEDMLVVAKDHPLAKKKVFPIKDLKDYPYIGWSEDQDSYNYDLVRRFDASLNHVMKVNNDYGCFAMISKGLGVGIHPKIMVENSMFPVKGISFDVESYTDITIGFRSYETLSLAAQTFVDFVQERNFE